ncbi:uncharacterized protein BYT42DRAFT_284922 [Radiomyces spectabilis]|uniref:uncharacterized protein n=1 Tax=Radiomyces spectabilis TaxID=64574 RepID=UPI00221EA848|nr:uncharacterized protein BYT42DRAFT_284922 [Radiomyces spectabilis]KAI8380887.1 hypothetical protein BYT42DRAFT_284922 [Radiomyces spectabilis]
MLSIFYSSFFFLPLHCHLSERRHKRRASFSPPPHGGRGYRGGPRGGGMRDVRERDADYPQDGDHYIPNYERDGYVPGPRYSNMPERQQGRPGGGYPMMDMMNVPMMGAGWPNMARPQPVDPNQLDYIIPFKQYCDYLRQTHSRSHFDDDELQKRYAKYKEKATARQLNTFFNNNKDKEWFQEKYHPKISEPRIADMKQRRRHQLDQFLIDLRNGVYDAIQYDEKPITSASKSPEEPGAESLANAKEEKADIPAADIASSIEYENQLVIKTVPPTIARQRIIEMCSNVDGFEYLALSEPSPNKKFHRIGWIHFKEGTDMVKAFEALDNLKIDDFTFHLAMNRKNQPQQRVHKMAPEIANTSDRLDIDFEQAQLLAKVFDGDLVDDDAGGLKLVLERAEEVIAKLSAAETSEDQDTEMDEPDKENGETKLAKESNERVYLKKRLDMIIVYLRNVHMFCYYCGMECDSFEELNRRCPEPHCRKLASLSTSSTTDGKQQNRGERQAAQWAKNLDQRIAMKSQTPSDRELERWGGKPYSSELETFMKEHVQKEHEAKFKCKVGECAKAFKGFDFVEKHIITKHPEEIARLREEVDYFNNYVRDPNHLTPAANLQSNMNMAMGAANMGANIPFAGPPSAFMVPAMNGGGRMAPPGMAMHAAAVGTPWDQIPRIGFGDMNWSNAMAMNRRTGGKDGMENFNRPPSASLDLNDSMVRDPRQVKNYVDLDAPAEGDADISFY